MMHAEMAFLLCMWSVHCGGCILWSSPVPVV